LRDGFFCFCAGLAQLVEQLICNQQVAGSSPITSFVFFDLVSVLFCFPGSVLIYGEIPKWPTGEDCKSSGSAFAGSNPALSTTLSEWAADRAVFRVLSQGRETAELIWKLRF
jgi:hypothetical protein